MRIFLLLRPDSFISLVMVQEWFVCLNMVFEGSPNRSSCKSLSIAEWMTAACFDEQILLKCTLMLILWKYTQNKTAELLKWLSKHFSMWENGCRPAPGSVYLAHKRWSARCIFSGSSSDWFFFVLFRGSCVWREGPEVFLWFRLSCISLYSCSLERF